MLSFKDLFHLPELVSTTFQALDVYQAGAEQFDDMTLLITEVFGSGSAGRRARKG
ncbi:MAG: hypothetical protein JW862_18820 [Anaerolineales bacterium]|nr:hypothetical protein [Anaerolineales bacterium]